MKIALGNCLNAKTQHEKALKYLFTAVKSFAPTKPAESEQKTAEKPKLVYYK